MCQTVVTVLMCKSNLRSFSYNKIMYLLVKAFNLAHNIFTTGNVLYILFRMASVCKLDNSLRASVDDAVLGFLEFFSMDLVVAIYSYDACAQSTATAVHELFISCGKYLFINLLNKIHSS